MASTFDNDLRLEEMATGENAGSWGTKTNTNLELIADAFGYGTFTIADADTTLTMPDGSDTDNALRSLYLKISSSADLTTTRVLTLAPNTVSKLWYIENNTSGGQTITISQGSGANVSILNGQAKLVATDGAGAGAAVIDVTQDLAIPDLFIDDDLSLQSDGAVINFGTDAEIQLTHVADTGLLLTETGGGAPTLQIRDSALSISSSADGQLDIDADTEVQITAPTVDIDASTEVNISADLKVDTDTLYVDSTNNTVGFGTSSPQARIDSSAVSNFSVTYNNFTGDGLHIQSTGTASDGAYAGGISFSRISADNNSRAAGIAAVQTDSDADRVGLAFFTHPDATTSNDLSEAMRIDAAQRVLIGDTTGRSGFDKKLEIMANDSLSSISLVRASNSTGASAFLSHKARGTLATPLIVQDDDNTLQLTAHPYDGTDYGSQSARISMHIDGTPGANDTPGRIMFETAADGASTVTERMRIDSQGFVGIGSNSPNSPLEIQNSAAGTADAIELTNFTGESSYIKARRGLTLSADYDDNSSGAESVISFETDGEEAARIDYTGRVLIGHNSSAQLGAIQHKLQIFSNNAAGISASRYSNTAGGTYLTLHHTRDTTAGGFTILQDDDQMGTIQFAGSDGTDNIPVSASISSSIDNTPGANDMPGRLVFATTADGATSPTERMRIDSAGTSTFSYPVKITTNDSIGLGDATPAQFGSGVPTVVFQGTSDNGRGGAINFREYAASGDGDITSQIYSTDGDDGYGFVLNAQQGLLKLNTGGLTSTALVVDQSQRVLIGRDTVRSIVSNSGLALFQIESSSGGKPASQITMNSNSSAGPVAFFAKTRGTANGSNTVVQGNDYYGSIQFAGADGTDTNTQAAMIAANVDGSAGSNDMPGRLTFWTTSDGSSSGTERMRLDNEGNLVVGTGGYPHVDNGVAYGIGTQRYGAAIFKNNTGVASGGSLSLTVRADTGGWAGILTVTAHLDGGANNYKHRIFAVSGRNTSCTFTEIGSGSGGTAPTIAMTCPSAGEMKATFTTGGATVSCSMNFNGCWGF